jgi:c-di-GMP-binding flagellar brake protein YcgR
MGLLQKAGAYSLPSAANFEEILWIIVLAGLAILALAVIQIYLYRKGKKEARAHNLHMLDETITSQKLSAREGDLLKRLAARGRLAQYVTIVVSQRVFEECLQKEMEYINELPEHVRLAELDLVTSLRKKLGFDKPTFGHALQSSRDIPITQNVKIERALAAGKETLASKVVANDTAALTLERPKKVGKFVDFERNETVGLHFFREVGGEYFMRTAVFAVLADRLVVRHVDALERSQQRSAVRTDVAIPVVLHVVPTPNYPDKDAPVLRDQDAIKGTMLDISSGGTRIEVEGDLPPDAKYVNMQFNLLTRQFDNITAELLKITGTGRLKYLNVEFRKISDDERAQVFNFVCQDQIWRKKGTH